MTPLHQWAIKWQVPMAALQDLQRTMGMDVPPVAAPPSGSGEAWLQSAVRLEASQKGLRVWRNNVGALQDASGRWMRFGLANDSKGMNASIKSGDLIGIRPVVVTQAHVGHTFGLFVSYECKSPGWTYSGTEHEVAQLKWQNIVNSLGGEARFVSTIGAI